MDKSIFQKLPILMRLPEGVLEQVLLKGTVSIIGEGDAIAQEGAPVTQISWLLDGRALRYVSASTGDMTVIDILSRGDRIGLMEACEKAPFTFSVKAMEDVQIFQVPIDDFYQLQADHFELQKALFANLSFEMRLAVKEINDLKLKTTTQRLGSFLLGLVDSQAEIADIELSFGKRLLAARLSMKPESLSRSLAKLKSYGVSSDRSYIYLRDIEALREYCEEYDELLEEGVK